MEKINDVMSFLNQMEFFNIINGLEYKTFIVIKNILLDEFSEVDCDKLVELLGIVDNLYMAHVKNELHSDKSLITILRMKVFEMCGQKTVEESDNA